MILSAIDSSILKKHSRYHFCYILTNRKFLRRTQSLIFFEILDGIATSFQFEPENPMYLGYQIQEIAVRSRFGSYKLIETLYDVSVCFSQLI